LGFVFWGQRGKKLQKGAKGLNLGQISILSDAIGLPRTRSWRGPLPEGGSGCVGRPTSGVSVGEPLPSLVDCPLLAVALARPGVLSVGRHWAASDAQVDRRGRRLPVRRGLRARIGGPLGQRPRGAASAPLPRTPADRPSEVRGWTRRSTPVDRLTLELHPVRRRATDWPPGGEACQAPGHPSDPRQPPLGSGPSPAGGRFARSALRLGSCLAGAPFAAR
jgi:hypothetical protein